MNKRQTVSPLTEMCQIPPKKPLTLIYSSAYTPYSKSTLAFPLQAYPFCDTDTINVQLVVA